MTAGKGYIILYDHNMDCGLRQPESITALTMLSNYATPKYTMNRCKSRQFRGVTFYISEPTL